MLLLIRFNNVRHQCQLYSLRSISRSFVCYQRQKHLYLIESELILFISSRLKTLMSL